MLLLGVFAVSIIDDGVVILPKLSTKRKTNTEVMTIKFIFIL